MSPAAKSLVAFGVYLELSAAGLLLTPGLLISVLYAPPADHSWLRVCGVLAAVIGYYYLVAARAELQVYFRATVKARLVASLAFVAMVALGLAPWQLLLLAAIDTAMAAWTYGASRQTAEG